MGLSNISTPFSSPLFFFIPYYAYLKSDFPVCYSVSVNHQLVSSLPLEKEPLCGSIWQTGLVVPHQVPAHKPTMVPRMQSGI